MFSTFIIIFFVSNLIPILPPIKRKPVSFVKTTKTVTSE